MEETNIVKTFLLTQSRGKADLAMLVSKPS